MFLGSSWQLGSFNFGLRGFSESGQIQGALEANIRSVLCFPAQGDPLEEWNVLMWEENVTQQMW